MPGSRGPSFFHELKRRNIFRVAIAFFATSWVVLQFVDVMVSMLSLPGWVGRFVLLFLLASFPVALILAWAFELTPDGLKLDKDVPHSDSAAHVTGRKLDFIIIGILATGLLFSVYLNFRYEPAAEQVEVQPSTAVPSIAVLPFDNRSTNAGDSFFIDGIHDDLLTHLAKISSLKVISRTSVLQYRNTTKSMRTIGEELGVSTLLEGAVQRVGDRIRINVQLIDARTDEHLWAEIYNSELTANNIFDIQEEISAEIARSLNATLSPDDQRRLADRPTDNLEAYEAYLLGRQKMASGNISGLRQAVGDFQDALQQDPDFVLAYVGLAESYMALSNAGDISKEEMVRRIRPLARRASELDEQSGGVYSILGAIAEYDGDIEQAEKYYRAAIDLNPEYSMARQWLGLMLWNQTDRLEESADLYRTTMELDPLGAMIRSNYGTLLTFMGDIEGGLANLKRASEINPDIVEPYNSIGDLYFFGKGDAVRAMLYHQKAASMDDSRGAYVGYIYAALGDFDTALEWVEPILTIYPDQAAALATSIDIAIARDDLASANEAATAALNYLGNTMPSSVPLYAYRNAALDRGAPDDALDMFLRFHPELFGEHPDVNNNNIVSAVDLVLVLQELDRSEESTKLIGLADNYLANIPSSPYINRHTLRAELSAMNGDVESAVTYLRNAVDENWLGYYWASPDRNPNLSAVHEDPGYRALMSDIRATLATQLGRVRDLIELGRLASGPDDLDTVTIELPVD